MTKDDVARIKASGLTTVKATRRHLVSANETPPGETGRRFSSPENRIAYGRLLGGRGSRPSRWARLRASLRARRTASARSRARFSDGFS